MNENHLFIVIDSNQFIRYCLKCHILCVSLMWKVHNVECISWIAKRRNELFTSWCVTQRSFWYMCIFWYSSVIRWFDFVLFYLFPRIPFSKTVFMQKTYFWYIYVRCRTETAVFTIIYSTMKQDLPRVFSIKHVNVFEV